MFCIFSVFSPGCLLDRSRADLPIKVGYFDSFCRTVSLEVEVKQEVEPVHHVTRVRPLENKFPGFFLYPVGKVRDS